MACCPFNPAHTFARNRLLFHLNTCKDKVKKAHLFVACKFNPLHFHPKEEIELHQLVCPDRADYQELKRLLTQAGREGRDRERRREKVGKKKHMPKRECKASSDSCSEENEE